MRRMPARQALFTFLSLALLAAPASAQDFGVLRWQLRPYCNVVAIRVVQTGDVFTLDGTDDQCGAATRGAVRGLAFQNPNGTIGFAFTIVQTPGAVPTSISATIALPSLSGTWTDNDGNGGTFASSPGAGNGGSPRPLPSTAPTWPSTIGVTDDGGFVARGTFNQGALPATGLGTRMMWYPKKAAFRAGRAATAPVWDDVNIGPDSVAMGLTTLASGANSVAFGVETQAIGPSSTAFGTNSVAAGVWSTAMGNGSNASGLVSTAFGSQTTATGSYATSMGRQTTASGFAATAINQGTLASGAYAFAGGTSAVSQGTSSFAFGPSTAAHSGSFVWADASVPSTRPTTTADNQFVVRAAGGLHLYTSANLTTGLRLPAGANQWSGLSDVASKHRFRDLEGEDVLARFAGMPVREWTYLTEPDAVRHIGPTAQDFHAAFGLNGDDSTRIGSMDADGVALAGVRALEARTRAMRVEAERLASENRDLKERLARLEAALAGIGRERDE